jgi:hypothetical protein
MELIWVDDCLILELVTGHNYDGQSSLVIQKDFQNKGRHIRRLDHLLLRMDCARAGPARKVRQNFRDNAWPSDHQPRGPHHKAL